MATISERTYSSACDMEQALVEAASERGLVLTATSRLARRILHCYRLERIEKQEHGWKTPTVFSLNRWVKNSFDALWHPFRPLTKIGALRLWDEATREVELPEGLRRGPSLNLKLQEAFDLLSRHGLELAGARTGHTLADWRREVFGNFLLLLEENRYLSWEMILERVKEALAGGRITLPGEIILSDFDELLPAEEDLVKAMSERSEVALFRSRKNPDQGTEVFVYVTPEDECQSISAEVLRSWNKGQRRLGVVFLDRHYFSLLKRSFEELTDREERPPDALRYNLTMGIPLSEHPLYQAALLPLRLPEEPQPSLLLSSLLFSPYVKRPEDGRDLMIKASLWSSRGPKDLEEALLHLKGKGLPIQPLQEICSYRRRPMKAWLQSLENVWKSLGFPLCRCETDTLAKEHFFKILEEMKKGVGHLEVGRGEVEAWFGAASQGLEVVEKTPETAGIQILNLMECRGMAFDRLWVLGCHGRALPQPVREMPFLDPDETRRVEGGTVEGRWEAGQRNLSLLLASSARVTFSRSMSKEEDAPFLPCPLIPDEALREDSYRTVHLWQKPPVEWLRARWFREGMRGLRDAPEGPGEEGEGSDFVLPPVLKVTEFEDLLSCPFKFFARYLLGLEPLEEAAMGIESRERGDLVHRILREFTRGLAAASPGWPDDEGKALEFLEKTVDEVLAGRLEDPFWQVERLRLLGDDQSPGLLKVWLEEERQWAAEGWRFEGAEVPFEGLRLGDTGVSLKGRVDRVDSHPEKGKAVWDYKTGDAPPDREVVKEMVRPQLPAYLLSLKEGLLPGPGGWDGKVRAGYISLKKASEVRKSALKEVDWDQFFQSWADWVKKRLEGPLEGLYSADPKPLRSSSQNEGGCKYCPFFNLCGLEDQSQEEDEGHHREGEME